MRTSAHSFGLPYWLDFDRPWFPRLDTNLTSDVVIIGAGISGVKLAHCLSRYGIRSVVLEARRVGEGASGRNQGTISSGAGATYCEAIQGFQSVCGSEAREYARELCRLGEENHELIRAQMEELGIECDYQQEGLFSLIRRDAPDFEPLLHKYRDSYELLNADGFQVDWLDEQEAANRGGSALYAGALANLTAAQFHSGKYVVGLAQALARGEHAKLFEQTRVTRISAEGSCAQVVTPHGIVTAAHVFLVTNALVPQHVPELADALRAERGQVFVTEPLPKPPTVGGFGTYMAWWREIPLPDGTFRFLFGGGRRRDEPDSLFRQFDAVGRPHPKLETEGFSPSETHQRRLDAEFAKLFPSLVSVRITHRWAGLQCFTADELPMIGVFDPARCIHGMAGFSGRGNTYTNVGAEVLAARVAGTTCSIEKRYGPLFDKLLQVGRSSAKWGSWETSNE